MIWIQAFGGFLLFIASVLVIGAVIATDTSPARPIIRRRRGKAADLRRAA